MRVVPLLSALAVMATLYLLVFERDALVDFAQGDHDAWQRTALAQALRDGAGTGDPGAASAAVPEAQAEVEPPAPPERRIAVVVQPSTSREIARAVIVRGRTEAAREVEVRAETAGRVISEPLSRGSSVAADEVLCRLAPGTRAAALDEARARLAEAEINATAAEQLSADGFASLTRAAAARAGLQAAQAAVAAAQEEMNRLEIRAPFAGILETDSAELGALMQPGAPCATVIALDPIRLVAFVPEMEIDRIEVGALAGARLGGGAEVLGRVTFLARAADPATRTFRVEIKVPNPDGRIRAGRTADIGIEAAGTRGHLVPGSALTLDDAGRLGLRLMDDDRRARFHPVEVVRDTPAGLWVTGLPDSADIIVVGQEFVADGVAIEPSFREPMPDEAGDTGALLNMLRGAGGGADGAGPDQQLEAAR